MAIFISSSSFKNTNNLILSLKVLLLSTAIFTAGVFLKLSVPVTVQFIVSAVPVFWNSLLLWLTPPYLYIVVNFIIITIAASSRFHHKSDDSQSDPVAPIKVPVDPQSDFSIGGFDSVVMKRPVEIRPEFGHHLGYESVVMKSPVKTTPEFGGAFGYGDSVVTNSPVKTEMRMNFEDLEAKKESKAKISSSSKAASDREFDDFVINRSTWKPIPRETKQIQSQYSFLTEKPPASVRFGHRKTSKASPEAGRTLGVSKPKRHDTLESTWKTITDGRPIPLARHLKKSDTWEREGHVRNNSNNFGAQDQVDLKMKKSETFNERNNNNNNSSLSPSPGSGKLKKESSLSQDELNRRVEAFIKKFNEEMRLQRQESLNQYKEMMVNKR